MTEQLTPELKAAFEAIAGKYITGERYIALHAMYGLMLSAHNYRQPLPETLTLQFEQIINNMPQEGQFTLPWLCELMGKARGMDRWVDVKERLPEIGMFSILVYGSYTADCPRRVMEVHYRRKGNKCEFRSFDGIKTKNVTHYQPLPNPPTQAVRKDGEG